jgi:hypothetical protein
VQVKELTQQGRSAARKARRDARRAEFGRRLREQWGKALDAFDELVAVTAETGDLVARRHVSDTPLFVAQELLRQRACQVSWEIHTLCSTGFADGAYARWRTLHEIAVVMTFLRKFGEPAAKRYFDHAHIKNRKILREYEDCQAELKNSPLPPEEVQRSEDKKQAALSKYTGEDFGEDYGWAAKFCGVPKPSFFHIRKAADYGFWKAHYGMANHSIHAGPHGVLFRLGHPLETPPTPLSGPSLVGLGTPLDAAAITLGHATLAFFESLGALDAGSVETNLEHAARFRYINWASKRVSCLASRANSRLQRRFGQGPKAGGSPRSVGQ